MGAWKALIGEAMVLGNTSLARLEHFHALLPFPPADSCGHAFGLRQ
jgi:hypothetical protein